MQFVNKYGILLLLLVMLSCQKEAPIPGDQNPTPTSPTPENPTPTEEPTVVKITPNDFLSANTYDQLVVEIQYVEGYQPKAESVNNLKIFLGKLLNKPSGITVVQTALPSPGKTAYSLADLRKVEQENRSKKTNGSTLTAYFFFADGDYAENSGNSKVLGIAYGSSSMVIFEKTIREFSGGLTKPPTATLETTVINHELAHILGLVNNGTPMETAHQDEPHGRHCTNKNCLMYYAAETSDIVGNLVGGNIPELDANCLADLKANGGK